MRIAVLGGGVSGLTAAYRLGKEHDVTLFEAGTRLGGNIRTDVVDGCRVEWGPNGFLDNEPTTLELAKELGLESRLVRARDTASRRFIWRKGRLRELPAKPPQFLTSDCLPLGSRLRALLEPFARKAPEGDESIHAFAARRLGRGSADILVDAFVTGVFAGDPKRLSVKSAFPKLAKLEAEYGSLIKGAKGRGFGPAGVLTSFDEGLQVLIDALAERVDVCLNAPWDKLERRDYDRVVCTIPAPRASKLADGPLAAELAKIPTAPVVVVAMILDEGVDVPDVFGFLAPRGQNLRILGTLYDSSIFPGRAPAGKRLFRTMIGGRRDPEAIDLGDEQLTEIVRRDLRKAWGFLPDARKTIVMRHPLGIAQYEIGHAEILERIGRHCPDWLTLTGSSYRGVSLNLCVKEALALQ
jgi:oxygen-dependent protoporphyrinogen oxidase